MVFSGVVNGLGLLEGGCGRFGYLPPAWGGEGGARGAGGGGIRFFIPGGGRFRGGGGAEGPGGCLRRIGEFFLGGGPKFFFRARNVHQDYCGVQNVYVLVFMICEIFAIITLQELGPAGECLP